MSMNKLFDDIFGEVDYIRHEPKAPKPAPEPPPLASRQHQRDLQDVAIQSQKAKVWVIAGSPHLGYWDGRGHRSFAASAADAVHFYRERDARVVAGMLLLGTPVSLRVIGYIP